MDLLAATEDYGGAADPGLGPAPTPGRDRSRVNPGWARPSGAAGLLLVVYLLWHVTHLGGSRHQQIIGDVFNVPFYGLAIVACLGAGRRTGATARLRRSWRLLAVGNACYLLGDIMQTVEEATLHRIPYPSPADLAYLSFYGFFFAGLVGFARSSRSTTRRVMLALDVVTVALAGAAVLWYFVAGPSAMGPRLPWLQEVLAVAYPLGDLLLLLGAAATLLWGVASPLRRALLTTTAGVGLYVLADVIWGYVLLHGTYQGGDWLDAIWIVASVLFTTSAAQQPVTTPDDLASVRPAGGARRSGWLPYTALGTTLGLMLVAQRRDVLFPNLSVTIVAVAVALVIGARQILAQRALTDEKARTRVLTARLRYLAFHDPLTAIPNRALFNERLERALDRTARPEQRVAVLLVDMDGFKAVNDHFGHEQGDELLVAVASRLAGCLGPDDTVARLGGDEFVILLGATDEESAADVGRTILDTVSRPVRLAGGTVVPRLSVGVALSRGGGPAQLLREADHALYQAKADGRSCLRVFADATVDPPAAA